MRSISASLVIGAAVLLAVLGVTNGQEFHLPVDLRLPFTLMDLTLSPFKISSKDGTTGNREFCYTPAQEAGTCVLYNECPYLVSIYNYNPRDRDVVNYLIASQNNCGRRSVNRNPIVCCAVPSVATQAPPPATTAPPPPPVVTQAPTPAPTAAPVTINPKSTGPNACFGPDGRNGDCKNIRECPVILQELQARSTNPEYVDYIRNSNGICLYVTQHVCCPTSGEAVVENPVTNTPPPAPVVTKKPPVNTAPHLLTEEENCGTSNVTAKRIVGGEPAEPGTYPWIALVGYTDQLGDVGFKCGGSLITSRHVLTAAHCLKSTLSTVRLGEHDLMTPNANIIDVPVVKVKRYETYTPKDGHNDLALLYLERDVEFTDFVKPVCLPISEPQRSKSFVAYTPFVAGWGRTSEGGVSSPILQQVQVPVLSNAVCQDRYKKLNKLISEQQFDEAVLCAGELAGGKDSCQGDSGGPLMLPMMQNSKTRWYQIGVVSYGIGCARAEVPGVYTKVQHFIDWIQQSIAEP